MGTTAEKLQAIMNSKAAIKSAIETKGQTVGNIPLDEYSSKIMDIQTGYNGEVLTVNIRTNQPDAVVPTSGIKVVINNTLETIVRDWPGYEISEKIPPGYSTEVSVTGAIGGFRNPMIQTFAPFPDNVRPLIFTYESEKVTVNVTKDDGATVSDVNLTVTNVLDGSVFYSGVAGIGIVLNIPFGTTFRVVTTAIYGYTIPDEQTFTASAVNRTISMVHEKIQVNYITINQTISDPATMISGDINGAVIQQIRARSHRVLGKYTGPYKMTVCRLNDTNSDKYFDNTMANANGTEGDAFMRLPRFFYDSEQISEDVWQIGFAMFSVGPTWKEWDGNDLIGVYEIGGSKANSVSRMISGGYLSQLKWKEFARRRGSGYTLVKYKHHNIMAILFYALYGNTNSQLICGLGTDLVDLNGKTNSLGMIDTTSTNVNTMPINFWGLENWWGNKFEFIDNVVVTKNISNSRWTITEDDGSTRDIQGLTGGGFVSKMLIGEHLDLIAQSYGGTATTGYCDYQEATLQSYNYAVFRSYTDISLLAGVSSLMATSRDSDTFNSCSRLAFRGEITEASSVAEFKAIPITN